MFSLLSEINTYDDSSWRDKIFLTFDIDWANDTVLEDTIDLVESASVPATWFITHPTPLIERLRTNPNFSLGIHPNFNNLLLGQACTDASSAQDILFRLIQLVPEAKVIRSHSLVQSERLVDMFIDFGLTHISNFFVPEEAGPQRPWCLWDEIICTPHVWQDNVSMRLHGAVRAPIGNDGLQIYDFHPIHVFLNTDKLSRYESARPHFHCPDVLLQHRLRGGRGTRDLLSSLLTEQ